MFFLTNLLPKGTTAFIAGGFAACPALAADVDVWVQVLNPEDLLSMRTALLNHFRTTGPHVVIEEPQPPTGVCLDMDDPDHYYGVQTVKVARITGVGLPIHVMVTTGSVTEVLDGFDVTTHMIAITDRGIKRGTFWTPLTCRPAAVNPNSGTPARLKKIAKRYGFLYTPDMEVLNGEVTQQSV